MEPNKFVTHGKTKVINGSILSPELGSLRLVLAPCSEDGKPASELHKLLGKKWKSVAVDLKGWYSEHIGFKLGATKNTAVQSDTWVIHCLCYDKDNKLDEKALAACVKKLEDMAKYEKASVHVSTLTAASMPGLADMLSKQLVEKGISVYYYEEAAVSQ